MQMGGLEISKYWMMGGWKNLIINGWVRHNGGVDLKIGGAGEGGGGGNPSQNNFGATKKLPPFDPMLQKYSGRAFQNCHDRIAMRYIFFYISMLVISVTIA